MSRDINLVVQIIHLLCCLNYVKCEIFDFMFKFSGENSAFNGARNVLKVASLYRAQWTNQYSMMKNSLKYPDRLFLEFAIAWTDGLPRFELKWAKIKVWRTWFIYLWKLRYIHLRTKTNSKKSNFRDKFWTKFWTKSLKNFEIMKLLIWPWLRFP